MHRQIKKCKSDGFALISSMSIMAVLVLIAMALFSLSSVATRSAEIAVAQTEAKANAKMALMVAIGELQKFAGQDTAITATSEILSASPAKPHLTGVWQSWDYDPSSGSLDYDSEKRSRFYRWLVSNVTPDAAESVDFAASEWNNQTIVLVGEGSLGNSISDEDKVLAARVPILSEGGVKGAYAWHVSDESVKVRLNHYRDPGLGDTLPHKAALTGGYRPDVSRITSPDGDRLDYLPTDEDSEAYESAEQLTDKISNLDQTDLLPAAGNAPGRIKPFRHDVTPYSLGLLTDVRRGGLKKDLSTIFELAGFSDTSALPAEFSGKGLYESTHGITGISDPSWDALASYYNTYKVLNNVETSPLFAEAPAESVRVDEVDPSDRFFPGPVIQKVEMLLSVVVRDTHSGATKNLKDTNNTYPFLGHLVFTPIVTLHNPYNVSITFDQMKVTMDNIPVSFLIYFNSQPVNTRLLNLSYYFFQNHKRGNSTTGFTIRIADWSNWNKKDYSNINEPIVMEPGQSLVCSPYLNPNYTWADITAQYTNDVLRQESNGRKAKPGWYGRCFGFNSDIIRPKFTPDGANDIQTNTPPRPNNKFLSYLCFKDLDSDGFPDGDLRVECAIRQPVTGTTKSGIDDTRFEVSAVVTIDNVDYDYGGLRFGLGPDDDNPNTDLFADRVFPAVYTTEVFSASSAYVPNSETLSQHENAKTFSLFSAYARTTNGGVYDNDSRSPDSDNVLLNGRMAGKPYLFNNPARRLNYMDINEEKPSAHSHELNVQSFDGLGALEDIFIQDTLNRTPILTGNQSALGIKSGSYLEVPIGPMQTIADFRRSNALTSPYLPNYTQPIANSRISPILSTATAKMNDADVASYDLLDHSLLANHALYDGFYFSSFAKDGEESPAQVFDDFMSGNTTLASQAFVPYLPKGETVVSLKAKLFDSDKPKADAYLEAAAYQMVKGPFNVNSTSIGAWKAWLAAASKETVSALWAKNATLEQLTPEGAPILPMSIVNGGPVGATIEPAQIDDEYTNDWNGYRELSGTELEGLATSIVNQVRTRGPFLSMSEFVNRRIGTNSELTRMGALEAAIGDANINDDDFLDQVAVTADDISDTTLYGFKTPEASLGNPSAGAPGWLSQGDLMRLLEPAATVRSDTFVIRVCGQAWDTQGDVKSAAYAEAVVQRLPEYIEPKDEASTAATTPANQQYGRRFEVVSFRWLSKDEI